MAFKRLSAEHYIAIKYLALPKAQRPTVDKIAEECGVHRSTIFEWKKDPLFERELKREIVRTTIDRLPDVFDAVPDIIIRDGNAAMFTALLKAHDMLTEKVDVVQADATGTIDIDEIRRRVEELRKRDQSDDA